MPELLHASIVVRTGPPHLPCFCVCESDALEVAGSRLPAASTLYMHSDTGWLPWRVVAVEDIFDGQ